MLNQAGGSRMDTLFKLVLIVVVSILSFSIGAFVGKQVSDTEHREAMLESEHGPSRGTASVDPHASTAEPSEALSEDEIASLTEEFVKAEKQEAKGESEMPNPIDAHKKGSHKDEGGYKKMTHSNATAHEEEETEEKPEPKKKMEQQRHVASAAKRVAEGKAPSKDPAPKRQPDSVLPTAPTPSSGKYTVQVASYATENEAQSHAANLKEKGYSAFYIPAQVQGKTWYRVSVGLFSNYNSAMAFRKELMREASVKSSIVQKIVK